jgi:hypothetical protein
MFHMILRIVIASIRSISCLACVMQIWYAFCEVEMCVCVVFYFFYFFVFFFFFFLFIYIYIYIY